MTKVGVKHSLQLAGLGSWLPAKRLNELGSCCLVGILGACLQAGVVVTVLGPEHASLSPVRR